MSECYFFNIHFQEDQNLKFSDYLKKLVWYTHNKFKIYDQISKHQLRYMRWFKEQYLCQIIILDKSLMRNVVGLSFQYF